jgi:hypothetical protein
MEVDGAMVGIDGSRWSSGGHTKEDATPVSKGGDVVARVAQLLEAHGGGGWLA